MSPEDVDQLVASRDADRIIEALKDLTEAERRKLSKHASDMHKRLDRIAWEWDDVKRAKLWDQFKDRLWTDPRQRTRTFAEALLKPCELICLGVCPLSVTRRIGVMQPDADVNHKVRVLDQRRPDWADQWLAHHCEGEFPGISWETARTLIEQGVCNKPDTGAYARLFAEAFLWRTTISPGPAKYLADRPDLLQDEVWRLFEHETNAFTFGDDDNFAWFKTLRTLSDQGHLDRERLLDASLNAAGAGFTDYHLGAFAKFHAHLEPRTDELAARQHRYADLLPSPTPRIVAFALDMLKALDKAKRLDDNAFLDTIAPAFDVRTKGPAKTALTLLRRVAKRAKAPAAGARAVIGALRHESEDVQAGAVALLTSCADAIEPDTAEALAAALPDLPATVQPDARALLKILGLCTEEPEGSPAADASELAGELRDRADAIDPQTRETLGLHDAIDAFRSGCLPPPLTFDIEQVPILGVSQPVDPIIDFEALIDAVAHAIEVVDDPMEVERILDGMCRLMDQEPDDFAARVAPLRRRVEPREGYEGRGFGTQVEEFHVAAPALFPWLGAQGAPPRASTTHPSVGWIRSRCKEVGQWIREGEPRPLLAAPTHEGGWIEPAALVERLTELQSRRLTPGRHDLMQAILRLAPDRRAEALSDAKALQGVGADALRWALGADLPKQNEFHEQDAGLWIAAGRSRTPRGRVNALQPAARQFAGPAGIGDAKFTWTPSVNHHKFDGRTTTHRYISIRHDQKNVGRTLTMPVSLYATEGSLWEFSRWLIGWRTMIWPANTDALLVQSVRLISNRFDDPAATSEPNDAFLTSLLDTDRPLSPVAALALTVGLVARDAEVKGVSLDALIQGIEDGRITEHNFGRTLAQLAQTPDWLALNRLAPSMAEAARVSPLHARVVADCLGQTLVGLTEVPRDLHHLLSPLLECSAQLGRPAPEQARAFLQSIKGSGKAAKAAKALLALPDATTSAGREALHQAAVARIERAERWQNAHPA